MSEEDKAGTPGETIGAADDAELNARPVTDRHRTKAVLFVPEGYELGQAVDIEIIKVNDPTFDDLVRKRT